MDTKLILLIVGAGAVVLIAIGALMDSGEKKAVPKPEVKAKPKRSKLPAIVLGLIVLAIAAGVAYYLVLVEMEKREVRQKYGAVIADMCQNPSGIASSANLPTAALPWKVVVLDDDGTRNSWHNKLPADRRATDQASTQIVACVQGHKQVIATCEYTTRTLDRIQYYADITLMNPETGLPITTFQVWGSTPRDCPELVTRNTGTFKGDDPAGSASAKYFDAFYTELMKTVQ